MVKPKLPQTGTTEALLFFGLFGVLWLICLVLFFFSCPWFGKIPSAELHPLSRILSTTVTPVSLRTSSRGELPAEQRGTAWLASGSGCGQLGSYTHPTHFGSTLSAKKKTPRSSICLLVTSFFSPLRALVLPSAAPTVFTLHQPVFPPGTFSCITASVAVVLSACSSLTTPVVRTVFKPAAFLRWKC